MPQRRLQSLRAELHRVTADRGAGRVRVTDGGKRLARTRHSLQAAGLTLAGWQEAWQTARWRIEAIGSGDERFGNLTITVTPGGEVSIRLPRPLEHLANAPRCRYVLSGRAKFSYRGDEWLVRITGHRPVSYTRRHSISAIAVEDLNFADARTTGRETMGRGRRGRRFRKTVAGIPTAVFRNRLTAQACRGDIQLYAVNPASTSAWGDQHWRDPYENVTRHGAAATVIGRRAQGHKARRREGVTRARPEDRAVRATGQTHQ